MLCYALRKVKRIRVALMDLKTAGMVIAIVTGILGLLGSVGAFFASNERTEDAISHLETGQNKLHDSSAKRIDDLQIRLNALSERMNSMDKMMAAHETKLQSSSDDLGYLRHWIEEISHRNSQYIQK